MIEARAEEVQWQPSGDPDRPLAYLPLPAGQAEALSPDEDGNMVWTSLEAVTRHPPLNADGTETLLRVTTRDGRTVDVTKAKSLLVHQQGKLVAVDGGDVKVGDQLPVCATHVTGGGNACLDMHTFFKLSEFKDNELPHTIELERDFGFLVGAYLSEGCLTKSQVHISSNDPVYREAATVWSRRQDIGDDTSSSCVMIHSRLLTEVLRKGCGVGDVNKHVPNWAFNAPLEFIGGLLDGYVGGEDDEVSCRSRMLRDGISTLMGMLGLVSKLSETVVEGEQVYACRIVSCNYDRCHDVMLDPIVSIEEVAPTTPWVYDLTVEGTRNMTAGNGLGLRDTFHTAGVLAHTVTQGVPRLKELIDLSAKIRTPSLRLVMEEPYSTHEHMARMLGAGVEHTVLHQIVSTSEVVWCPVGTDTGPDASMVQLHEALDEELRNCEGMSNSVIRFVLDRTLMCCKQLSVDVVGEALAAYMGENGSVIWSEVNMVDWVIRMRLRGFELNCVTDASTPVEEARELEMKACRTVHDYLLDNVPVHGVGGITRVVVRRDMVSIPDSTTGALVSTPRWSADTEGTNLDRVLALKGVDSQRTRSNDIYETLAVLGVEAATHQLLTEIRTVLSHDGAYVNDRHLQLLVDVMTHTGDLAPVTRHSMMKLGASVYTRASFEQTQDVLTWAASMGVDNPTHGVTENIMLGTPIDGGTGACDIITHEHALPPPPSSSCGVKPMVHPTNRGTRGGVAPLKRPTNSSKPVKSLVRPLNAETASSQNENGFVGKKRKRPKRDDETGESKKRQLILNSPILRKPDRNFVPHSPTLF
jgi:DNA-directed RNA polymerase beta' subunit